MKEEQGLINYNNFLTAVFRKYYLILIGALAYVIQLFFIIRFEIKDLFDYRFFSAGRNFFSISTISKLFEFFTTPLILLSLIETFILIWIIIIIFNKSKRLLITPLMYKEFKKIFTDYRLIYVLSVFVLLLTIVYLATVITSYFKLIMSDTIKIICFVFSSLFALYSYHIITSISFIYRYKELLQDYMIIPLYQIENKGIFIMNLILIFIFWVGTFIVYSRHVKYYDI